MAKSQSSTPNPDAVLSTLTEADAALAAQEAELTAQLMDVQEKRLSLKSVMDLFGATETSSAPVTSNSKASTISAEAPAPTETPTEAPKRGRRGSKAAEAPVKGKRGAKAATSARSQSSENWQDYLRLQFRQTSLPAAIASVMQQQPDRLFGMVELIAAIFEDDLPKPVRNKARDRILNILSLGVKDGQWYRGRKGQYSVSRNAVEAASS